MSRSLTKSAGFISAATLLSRVLGLVRDQVSAYFFGTSLAMDAFNVATRIPTLLRDLFAEGAMSAAFVPTITRYLTKDGKPAAFKLASNVLNALIVVTGALVLLGIVFAEPLVRFFTRPSFQAIPGAVTLTAELTRVNMPFLLLIAIAAACMGVLNAMRRFFMPSLAPAMYNIVFIVCTVIGVPLFRALGLQPIMALSCGMLLGGVAQIVAQIPTMRSEGYRHQWSIEPSDPGLREVLILMGPGSLGVAAAQINNLVSTYLATDIPSGPSSLAYAFRFMYMPVGIFGVAIATAAIPDLAKHAALGSHDDMRTTLSWGMRLMLALSVPATVGLMALALPITQLIFERGHFNADSSAVVSQALFFYAPGIVGYSLVKILSPSFYSMKDARTPVIVSVVTVLSNAILNVLLFKVMGLRGLPLGTTIAATINAGLLLWLLSKRIGGLDGGHVVKVFLKIVVASAAMGAAAYFTEAELHRLLPAVSTLDKLVRVAGGIGAGVITLVVAAHFMHIEEFRQATDRVLKKVRG
jgi:putative peptidoglycan lipid II flippase